MKRIQLDDFQMYVDPNDPGLCHSLIKRATRLQNGIDPGPKREPAFTWLLENRIEQLCKQLGLQGKFLRFIDLGANVGLFTLIMNHIAKKFLYPTGYFVDAIEPDPDNFKLLMKNIELNGVNGMAYQRAISDYDGKGDFQLSSYSNLGALKQHPGGWGYRGKQDKGTCKIFVRKLPTFINETHYDADPTFIKMDIEGGEVEMLRGARDFLSNVKNCDIFMEVHPMFYDEKRSLDEEMVFLFDNGWTCEYMISAAVLVPDEFKKASLKPIKEFPSKGHSRAVYFRGSQNTKIPWHSHVRNFACYEHHQEVPGKKPSKKIVRSIMISKGE